MAWLTTINSNGSTYVYLLEYVGEQEFKRSREQIVYKFGRIEVALKEMEFWYKFDIFFPDDLRKMGYDRKNLNEWIKQLEKKKSRKLQVS